MLRVSRNKIILSIAFIALSLTVDAQSYRNGSNFNRFNTKPYYFGLSLGLNSSNFKIKQSPEILANPSFLSVDSENAPAFQVALIGNLKLGRYFDFRILPGFSFVSRSIVYQRRGVTAGSPIIERDVSESTFLDFPIQFRFKSQPYNNKRLYVIAGLKYSYDFASNNTSRQSEDNQIFLTPNDFSAEVGAGIQLFFPFFIFSPEIKYSHGISNIHIINSGVDRSDVIDKLLSRSIQISLHFEG